MFSDNIFQWIIVTKPMQGNYRMDLGKGYETVFMVKYFRKANTDC